MIKREASATVIFRHYLRANPWERTTWYEMKQTKSNCIAFSAFEQHQLDWLLACKHGTTNYKIPDDSRGVKPVDGIFTCKSDAVVVIKYPDFFAIIDIDDFLEAKLLCSRKSLTADHAKSIANKIVTME